MCTLALNLIHDGTIEHSDDSMGEYHFLDRGTDILKNSTITSVTAYNEKKQPTFTHVFGNTWAVWAAFEAVGTKTEGVKSDPIF